MNNIKLGILGGDLRYKYMYDMLKKDGFSIKCFENPFIENSSETLENMLNDINILITPIPFSKDKKNIFLQSSNEISFENLLEKLKNYNIKKLIGGVIPKNFEEDAKKYNISIFDFLKQDDIAIANAIPTAEGAIQTAMQESPKTIFNSKCIVLGYGRCGKILANTLKGLNANVTATYRKEEDKSYIKAFGYKDLHIKNLKENIYKFDFIFNTIPSCILNEEILKNVKNDSIIIDLAEAPGGVDYNFARKINIKAIYCPGLPGRVAPYYAGKILKNALIDYLSKN